MKLLRKLSKRSDSFGWAALIVAVCVGKPLPAADAPHLRTLRTQQVGDSSFFQVRFDPPVGLAVPAVENASQQDLPLRPRLVPQDDKTYAVYGRFSQPVLSTDNTARQLSQVAVEGLEFVGKFHGKGQAKFLLLYPVEEATAAEIAVKENGTKPKPRNRSWVEVPVTLNFAAANEVPVPEAAKKPLPNEPVSPDDLQRLWALGQAGQFGLLEAESPGFSFYPFAREATGRKYGVPVRALASSRMGGGGNSELLDKQLYETTTGAAAITESLQLRRMTDPASRDTGERKVPIAHVPGIDIAEHPWEKMIGNRKPAAELLARLVPQDNYYLHVNHISRLLDFAKLSDQWGTNLLHAYEIRGQDAELRQRYEKQLCIKSSALGRLLGPTVIGSLAITGNDIYLREGSDVSILFQVRHKTLFLAGMNHVLAEARREFKGQLRTHKEDYYAVSIESFVSPLREISLYRAMLGDVMIYSNSPAGVRRIIDTRQGRHKSLADSLDFRYMRTVFATGDDKEDGFVFLSDLFIRRLVGPESKIKEKRRLEALAGLSMVTNAALFTAWETGKLPKTPEELWTSSGLKAAEVVSAHEGHVVWDSARRLAISDRYNTLHFATPLIEMPMDKVTDAEAQSYGRFRAEYLGLWRQYFDPIGMRFSLRDARVRLETYILPLIQNSAYNTLRREVGNGTTTFDPADISGKTLIQFLTHINPRGSRNEFGRNLAILGGTARLDFLGDWFMVKLDDSQVFNRLAELALKAENGELGEIDPRDGLDLLFQVPLTVGVSVRQPLILAGLLGGFRTSILAAYPDGITWGPIDPTYKGVTLVKIQAKPELTAGLLGPGGRKDQKPLSPAIYYATIDGALYVSLREDCLKGLIDRSVARRQSPASEKKGQGVEINSSLHLAPAAAVAARPALGMLLEREVRRRALGNTSILYALYRGGLVSEKSSADELRKTALHFLGFVPVSADAAPYTIDAKTDEVRNQRHGSLRRPSAHTDLEKVSSLGQFLEQLLSLRADLRFHEDGIQTVLTIERKRTGK